MKRALLVIDVQQGLIEMGPVSKETYLNNVHKAIQIFHDNNEQIIFFQHTEAEGFLSKDDRTWELFSELDVRRSDAIFSKTHHSVFRDTELESYLVKNGITNLVVCGMQAEYCVDTTIKVAFEKHFDVTIIENATSTFNRENISGQDILDFYEKTIWQRFGKIEQIGNI